MDTLSDSPADSNGTGTGTGGDFEARELFEQGRVAFDEGKYRDSWDYFRRSYAISKRPKLLFNIGQSADRLGKDAEALASFRMYLEKLPDAENRRDVENRIKALEARMPAPQAAGDSEAKAAADDVFGAAEPEAPATPDPEQPTRKDWYLRGALGIGARAVKASGDAAEGTINGGGLAFQCAAGITLLPGIAVGGVLTADSVGSISVDGPGATRPPDSATIWTLGAIADWYVNPNASGLHLLAELTVGGLSFKGSAASAGTAIGAKSAAGGAVAMGGGYEWTLGRQLGLGVMGQVTVGRFANDSLTYVVFIPNVLATITWW